MAIAIDFPHDAHTSSTKVPFDPSHVVQSYECMNKLRMQYLHEPINSNIHFCLPMLCTIFYNFFILLLSLLPRLQFHDEFVPGSPGVTRSNLKERETNQWPLAPLTVLAPFTRVPFVPA